VPATTQSGAAASDGNPKRMLVIGNGMVGQRFIEKLLDLDLEK
jgi:hypothetical protein